MSSSLPEWAPAAVERIPTPGLFVNLHAVDRNDREMARILAGTSAVLRPHFKAHKCTRLLRRQVETGGWTGVTCGTSHEAAALGRAGFTDILVANEVAERRDIDAIAQVARSASVTVVVDHRIQVERLAAGAATNGVMLGVLIDIDVGLGRTGVPFDGPALLDLARAIDRAPLLTFRGIQAYEGHAMLQSDPDVRRTLSRQVAALVRGVIDDLSAAGFQCDIVSGGGTGTAELAATDGLFTEIQAGSYVLMDTTYGAIGLGFEQALYGVATVISRRSTVTAAINAGTKAMSVDKGMPKALVNGAQLVAMGDEHGRLLLDPATSLDVGDRVMLVPSHVDPTVNLHDVLYVELDGRLEAWPIDGRRTHGGNL